MDSMLVVGTIEQINSPNQYIGNKQKKKSKKKKKHSAE